MAAQILEALPIAAAHGLELPLVWNSGGYDRVDTLRLFEGVVDIFMPDAKVWDPEQAQRLLLARDYPEAARAALAEMHRQVGDLIIGERGTRARAAGAAPVLPGARRDQGVDVLRGRAVPGDLGERHGPVPALRPAHEFSGLRPITRGNGTRPWKRRVRQGMNR